MRATIRMHGNATPVHSLQFSTGREHKYICIPFNVVLLHSNVVL